MGAKLSLFQKPTKEQLEESYSRLKSVRKVASEFGYTGEGIRVMMHNFGLNISKPNKNRYSCDEEFFSKTDEHSFYVAGFYAADGCVMFKRKTDSEPCIVYMALGIKDADHFEKIKNTMTAQHPLSTKVVKNSFINPAWKDSEEKELRITSRQMCRDLAKFNIVPRKTHIYTFPEWLIDHPLVNHFMRGYFDGDGSFYIQDKNKEVPQICFNLRGTLPFLYNYRSILERECTLNKRVKDVRTNNGIGVLEYGGNGIVGKIVKFLYKDATIYLDRKYQIIKDLL